MALALMIEANGWVVALAAVVFVGTTVLFWRHSGKITTKLGAIEIAAEETARTSALGAVKAEQVAVAVGTPNGAGPVVKMVEDMRSEVIAIRESQAGMALRIADSEKIAHRRHEENKVGLASMGARLSEVVTRLDVFGVPQVDE